MTVIAMMMLGLEVEGFGTMVLSLHDNFRMMFDEVDLEMTSAADFVLGVITFNIMLGLIMFNITIAIIIDMYESN